MKTTLRKSLVSLFVLSALSAAVAANAPVAYAQTGRITGIAFEDRNGNGRRDAGEPVLSVARYKVTDGGRFFVCGPVFGNTPYSVGLRPGVYYVMPIAGPGQYATRPVIKAEIKGTETVQVDLPFGSNPLAVADNCGAYEPPRTARDPLGLVETAIANGFATLPQLINRAGLVGTLSGGTFTVFAPTDLAFAQLTEDELNAIAGDRALLRSILTYHVVPGVFTASSVVNAGTLTTVNGKTLTVRVEDGEVFINDARVIQTDVTAANGVIHVIDTVLVP